MGKKALLQSSIQIKSNMKEKTMKHLLVPFFALALVVFPSLAQAEGHAAAHDVAYDTVAVQGYDLVSYQIGDGVPVKGNGHNVASHEGITYLFSNGDNKKTFEANPEKYLPAYGGYCAFGVTKGKKFVSDPLAYKIVDGKLYLNLDAKIQRLWVKDIPGNITEANGNWKDIKATPAADL